jgi:hypothetical protein
LKQKIERRKVKGAGRKEIKKTAAVRDPDLKKTGNVKQK